MRNYLIEVEGIDKSGKNSLIPYVNQLSNYKYVIHDRGLLSMMVYSEKYHRNYEYEIDYKPIIIYLTVDEDDWNIRCKLANEPKTNYHEDVELFEKYKNLLKQEGLTILEYNTSKMTMFQIAQDVINKLERN